MEKYRLTRKQKESNDYQYYKDKINGYTSTEDLVLDGLNYSERKHKMKINYNLFNNKLDIDNFKESCSAFFGKEVVKDSEKKINNRDILSGKIKALLGMEMRRPFSWKIIATNEEATTRKEQEEFGMIRDYVIQTITEPIRQQVEAQYQQQQIQQQQGNEELTPEQIEQANAQAQQQMEQEIKAMTPPEVKLYMEREHQDPAEILAHQILEYLLEKQDIKNKFNLAWKHGLISGDEIFWVGIENKEPVLKVINPLVFGCGKYDHFIEEAEYAYHEEHLTIAEIVNRFGDVLTTEDIDALYEELNKGGSEIPFELFEYDQEDRIKVLYCEWKDLKPLKFIYGEDLETGEPYEIMVDESYKLNKEAGDIKQEIIWVAALFSGIKIGQNLYIKMGEVPGQMFNIDNPNKCELSYKGCSYDNLNSEATSLMDRLVTYQYLYNLIVYRIETLMASDKGKILFANSGMIPLQSSNLTLEQWFHFTFVNQFGMLNPNEEGTRQSDITQAVKEIDLSLISDIKKYLELAEYIERRCGESVGITKQIEGQIGSNEAVKNTQQAIVQSANILEPYFEVHNIIKRNVLQALIETAKIAYSTYQPKHIIYTLDDFSQKILTPDYDLLDNSTYGLFVSNSMKADEALQMVRQLAHAAMQNQAIELSDVMKVMRSESIPQAEELLKKAEKERQEQLQIQQQAQQESQEKMQQEMIAWEKEKMALEHQYNMEEIKLKGELELQKQTILSLGFNEDKDLDKDGTPDVLEVFKAGVDAEIKQKEIELRQEELNQRKEEFKDKSRKEDRKLDIEERKAKAQVLKSKVSSK